MKVEISSDLLEKYLRGETTLEESDVVDKWYSSFDKKSDDAQLQNPKEHQKMEKRLFAAIQTTIRSQEVKPLEWAFPFTCPIYSHSLRLAAAVSIVAIMGIGAMLLYNQKPSVILKNESIATTTVVKRISNSTSSITQQTLEDGTIIKLQPNSSIEFPERFAAASREIQLTGEAFFDVAKEKNRPFIITTGKVMVKVLGTSFNVKAYEGAKEITVAVKTGKVSVSAKTSSPRPHKKDEKSEIILTPNQEVVFNTFQENFSKKLVDNPVIILAKPTLFEMQYDGAPVVKILDVLQENYGIDIDYDRTVLSGCILTTSMAEEGLYERIEIICKAINATYERVGDRILIRSNGCL